jgi:hypothetical protein
MTPAAPPRPTCVAYYLGQFQPTPENDAFWGAGFSEWHNVARARPLFPGHRQPQLPGRLGFYDLRCGDTLAAQLEQAWSAGVDAFCHWHYWFAGRRLLHAPLDAMLREHPGPLRFMLGWANESWTGTWHGLGQKVLVEQTYSEAELDAHAQLIARYIDSGRWLCLGGAGRARYPFLIYKPRALPDARRYLGRLRDRVRAANGAELYLVGNWSPGLSSTFDRPDDLGLDAAVVTPVAALFARRWQQALHGAAWRALRSLGLGPEVGAYRRVEATLSRAVASVDGPAHASIVSGWDNSPRSGRRALVLGGYHEASFRRAAAAAIALEQRQRLPLLFVKSWNEWAEGNVMEDRFGQDWSACQVLRELLGPRAAEAPGS